MTDSKDLLPLHKIVELRLASFDPAFEKHIMEYLAKFGDTRHIVSYAHSSGSWDVPHDSGGGPLCRYIAFRRGCASPDDPIAIWILGYESGQIALCAEFASCEQSAKFAHEAGVPHIQPSRLVMTITMVANLHLWGFLTKRYAFDTHWVDEGTKILQAIPGSKVLVAPNPETKAALPEPKTEGTAPKPETQAAPPSKLLKDNSLMAIRDTPILVEYDFD